MTRPLRAAVAGCSVVHLVAVAPLAGLAGSWSLGVGLAAIATSAAVVARSRNAPDR